MQAEASSRVDLSEVLTDLSRRHLLDAAARQMPFFFDHEGGRPQVDRARADAITRLADFLLNYTMARARHGSVFFSVRAQPTAPLHCRLELQVADAGGDGPPSAEEEGGAEPAVDLTTPITTLGSARSLCTLLGGRLEVGFLPGEGSVLRACLDLDGPCEDEEDVDAGGAEVWLIGEPPIVYESLTRRMQRLGWRIRLISTAGEARQGLGSGRLRTPPALVLGSPLYGVHLDELVGLRPLLDAATAVAFLPPSEQAPDRVPAGIDVIVPPLSPSELLSLTRQAIHFSRRPSGETVPAALTLDDRPRLLVADDNEVNQRLFAEMLQVLGYEVDIVGDGQAAVAYCLSGAPRGILMDVMMPRMNGLEATRALRRHQAAGELPYFPIIAATALVSERDRHDCLMAGMDGYLSKPMDLRALAREIYHHVPLPQGRLDPAGDSA
ncbi:response regulator [Aquabacterium sp. A7-Y]|uniref:response regulator n=1 Tax=Aquabacterium sp. A7-Y TaxID=1349605 RepID=UPI00223CC19C|nr:response regulator [Aquabacterium sp. A7-Y]MCW7540018.1 response regulator [Aquabacterium sp. A7-Y]